MTDADGTRDHAAPEPLTPELFTPARVSAESRAMVERLEALIATAPPVNTRRPEDIRAERAAGRGIFPKPPLCASAQWRTIEGPSGALRLRVFRPDRIEGVYLHIHGGGWMLGGADGQDPMLERLSKSNALAVVSVDYRLAPEHPYPAAPEDCEAAALWLARRARAEFGTDRLLIGGESAGAHLALLTLLRLRDAHRLKPFSGANLVYGMYDLAGTPSVRNWGARNLILSTDILAWFVGNFLPPDKIRPVALRSPAISPLYADLRDMPEALISVGTLDPLLDDSLFLHARWIAAGRPAELAVFPGGVHGFNALPGGLAAEANARIDAFLTRAGRAERAPPAPAAR
ncbi:MAG: alpha/beta hydrolase fold domain-containing protein, partial [Alphaproteobacteria bacterium]|nr:alpha/beta hydrolase fold domain-containing protein [Alphaproteobacteria bacterium]